MVGSGTPEPGGSERAIFPLKKVQRLAVLQKSLGERREMDPQLVQLKQPLSLMIRKPIDVLNQQAKTAIASGDPEQGSAYVEAGVTGAKALGSQRRYHEVYDNFKQRGSFGLKKSA